MSGLNLIQSYLSESSDSEADNEPETKPASISNPDKNPLKIRLPVPQSILSWEGAKHHEDVEDDPSLHDGRTRSFKHERGNWATLVYIDSLRTNILSFVDQRSDLIIQKKGRNDPDLGNDLLRSFLREVAERFGSGLKPFDEFHLSLTKSLVLKFHWIESFVDGVRSLCRKTDKILIEFSELKVYCNEERTRTFLAIRCEDRNKNLRDLVAALDKLLAEYQLPPFYEEASFHVSVMWCLGDEEETLSARLPVLDESLSRIYAEDLSQNRVEISCINCKIGNKMYSFSLK